MCWVKIQYPWNPVESCGIPWNPVESRGMLQRLDSELPMGLLLPLDPR